MVSGRTTAKKPVPWMARWLVSVLLVMAPWEKSMTVLAVFRPDSGNCSGKDVLVPGRSTLTLLPANLRREALKAVRTPPLMLALITSIQASTARNEAIVVV